MGSDVESAQLDILNNVVSINSWKTFSLGNSQSFKETVGKHAQTLPLREILYLPSKSGNKSFLCPEGRCYLYHPRLSMVQTF